MSDTKRKIGLRADKIRVEKGMTIHEFCEKSGMGIKAATSFFSGKGLMRISEMVIVSHALGCSLDVFLAPKRMPVIDPYLVSRQFPQCTNYVTVTTDSSLGRLA